jgi:hypothetical protein
MTRVGGEAKRGDTEAIHLSAGQRSSAGAGSFQAYNFEPEFCLILEFARFKESANLGRRFLRLDILRRLALGPLAWGPLSATWLMYVRSNYFSQLGSVLLPPESPSQYLRHHCPIAAS